MNQRIFKSFVCAVLLAGLVGCAQENGRVEPQYAKTDESVTLYARSTGGYVKATYSFRYLTRDNVELTRNNWELKFKARPGLEDQFAVNMVVDDNSFLYDLGERSCKDIQSSYPDSERAKNPFSWLAASDANPSELEPARRLPIQVGHCYLVYSNDSRGRVIALFHVLNHIEDRSVTIHEIEVLDRR